MGIEDVFVKLHTFDYIVMYCSQHIIYAVFIETYMVASIDY